MKKIWVNKAKSFKEAEEFDRRYWEMQGARIRFIAAWKAVEEFYRIKGIKGYSLRLQKSVENIKYIS